MSHKRTPGQDVKHTVNRDALLMGLYLGAKLDGIEAQQAEQTRLARLQWWNSLTPAQQAVERKKAGAQAREQAARADVQSYQNAKFNAGLLYWIWLVIWLVVLVAGALVTLFIVWADSNERLPVPVPLAYGLAAVLLYGFLVFRARERRERRREAAERLPGARKPPTA